MTKAIRHREFTNTAWTKPDREKLSPNLTKLTLHFNSIAKLVTVSVVNEPLKPKRVEMLNFWIQVLRVN